MYRVTSMAAMTAMALASVLACACTPSPSGPSLTPGAPSITTTRVIAPGISEWSTGAVEAAGWVRWIDLEGGFWALADAPAAAQGSKQPKVVAVLLPGAVSVEGIAALTGDYVVASGRIQGGASIRMAGPELVVDTIGPARATSD